MVRVSRMPHSSSVRGMYLQPLRCVLSSICVHSTPCSAAQKTKSRNLLLIHANCIAGMRTQNGPTQTPMVPLQSTQPSSCATAQHSRFSTCQKHVSNQAHLQLCTLPCCSMTKGCITVNANASGCWTTRLPVAANTGMLRTLLC
jgi:hypothetical protein